MDFFLTNKLVEQNSGVEHAEMARLKVFKRLGRKAAIVTYIYANHTHDFLKTTGLADGDVINLFDFFAGTCAQKSVQPSLSTFGLPLDAKLEQQSNGNQKIYVDQRLAGILEPDQFDPEKMGAVSYLDAKGRTYRKAYLDSRGFVGTAIYLNGQGQMTREEFYRPDGTCYLTAFFAAARRRLLQARGYLLQTAKGPVRFTSWRALQSYFYDCLNADGPHVFISDRAGMTTGAMLAMQTKAICLEHEHSIHFKDYWDPDSACILPRWDDPDFFKQLQGIVVPTVRQRRDVIKRFAPACPVFAVPVGVCQKQTPVPFASRKQGELIAVARPAYQKQLAEMILAVGHVHQRLANVHLTIYGVPAGIEGDGELNMLKQLVATQKLAGVVDFGGYVADLNAQYDQAQVALLTSRFEGCALATVEAQAHGLPQIAYELNYGTEEVITDGVDGAIVAQGDMLGAANKLFEFLTHPKRLAQMSAAAYQAAGRFSEANIATKWQQVLTQVEA